MDGSVNTYSNIGYGAYLAVYESGLSARRERLEKNDYRSKKNVRLKNYELYQSYFRMVDQINPEVVKVRGHQAASQKNDIDRLFNLVDRASRNSLRREYR